MGRKTYSGKISPLSYALVSCYCWKTV